MAMVALGPNARLSPAAICADLAQEWPSLPRVEIAEAKEGSLAIQIGNQNLIAGLMPAPIPWSDLEGPCATSWLWKDAAEVLRRHAAHLILTVAGADDPVERMRLLTQATASIVATCTEVVGVFWTHAALVIQPELFREFAIKVIERPLYVWVDFRVFQNDKGRWAGFTTGLESLGHLEFEIEDSPDSPGELRERLFSFANYVLENGPVVRDGDTIGGDANERILVNYAPSAFGGPDKVMRLEFASNQQRRLWWRPW